MGFRAGGSRACAQLRPRSAPARFDRKFRPAHQEEREKDYAVRVQVLLLNELSQVAKSLGWTASPLGVAILATPSEFLHSEICESLRAALFQVFGSPLPSAGEGLGVRGETAMPRLETSDQNMANAPSLTSRARELRHSDTLAEKLAWKLLRNCQVLHHKFRRQVPLGNAIVDFCCLSLKLVVELDGAGHAHGSQTTRDRQRDRQLEKGGYRVLRFPNGIVLKAPTEFVKKDSGVHRPVGSGSLERASLRKPV